MGFLAIWGLDFFCVFRWQRRLLPAVFLMVACVMVAVLPQFESASRPTKISRQEFAPPSQSKVN